MKEVRKLLKQETVIEEAPQPKERKGSEFFQLCLVRIGSGQIVPVYLPAIGGVVYIGDHVVFDYNGDRYQAEVMFVADYLQEDDQTWTCATIATQTVPVKAIQIGHMKTVEWKEEK